MSNSGPPPEFQAPIELTEAEAVMILGLSQVEAQSDAGSGEAARVIKREYLFSSTAYQRQGGVPCTSTIKLDERLGGETRGESGAGLVPARGRVGAHDSGLHPGQETPGVSVISSAEDWVSQSVPSSSEQMSVDMSGQPSFSGSVLQSGAGYSRELTHTYLKDLEAFQRAVTAALSEKEASVMGIKVAPLMAGGAQTNIGAQVNIGAQISSGAHIPNLNFESTGVSTGTHSLIQAAAVTASTSGGFGYGQSGTAYSGSNLLSGGGSNVQVLSGLTSHGVGVFHSGLAGGFAGKVQMPPNPPATGGGFGAMLSSEFANAFAGYGFSEMQKPTYITEEILRQIQTGEEARLTIMLKRIPRKYDYDMFIKEVCSLPGVADCFSLVYLPTDSAKFTNRGYAFVSLKTPGSAVHFIRSLQGYIFRQFNPRCRPTEVYFANRQ